MKLLVISHTPHYASPDGLNGWGPTVREIDALACLFTGVVHLAIFYQGQRSPESCLPYHSSKIRLRLLPPAGGQGLIAKIKILLRFPQYLKAILAEIENADFVQIRCPANISLLGLTVLALTHKPHYRWVKYAGNWDPSGSRPVSYSFQRWLLVHNFHKGEVTVNGSWPGQQKHIHTFDNPSFSADEAQKASQLSQNKVLNQPVQLLFVGRLESAKGLETVLQVARNLKKTGIRFDLNLIGDGQQRAVYQDQVDEYGLRSEVHFAGWLPHPEIAAYYSCAHFLLLPSMTEGWPKVLSEGMAYGVVPLSSAVSSIPQNLARFGCGRAFHVRDVNGYVQAIQDYINSPQTWLAESRAGLDAARYFTYESYLDQIKKMAKDAWDLNLAPTDETGAC